MRNFISVNDVSNIDNLVKKALAYKSDTFKDKEIGKVLKLLPREATYYFTKANIPRALNESELQHMGTEAGLAGKAYPSISDALDAAVKAAAADDLILICGSVFLVGEVPVNL